MSDDKPARHAGARESSPIRAVLSSDYLTAPVKEIGKIRSVLTMVGGNVVYAAAPFANLAPQTP